VCPSYLDGDHPLRLGVEAGGDTRFIGKTVQFSRTVQELAPAGLAVGLSKLNSMRGTQLVPTDLRRRAQASCAPATTVRSTLLGPAGSSSRVVRLQGRSRRSNPGDFPRKEVIQPHLPVRLPCYDFTPVTSPTFDGSLPKGLGHRLRVLLASVV
jgi:hypothetical protein